MAHKVGTAVAQHIIDTLSGKAQSAMSWGMLKLGGWFSPNQPLAPVAPEDVTGRTWDYPTGYNLRLRPRDTELTQFEQLRSFAQSYDVLRLLIETRKDQMCRLKWSIKTIEGGESNRKTKAVEKLLKRPDGRKRWTSWLRQLLEDMLVIDAATIYPQATFGGELHALKIIDGATIRPIIDYYGDHAGYQQVLKGLPAVDYSLDELLYQVRNPRSNKVYGYSPVEQIIMTVNIALRRQLWQLDSFTKGNIPDVLVGLPPEWTPDQIKSFQLWWDEVMDTGGTQLPRHAKMIPKADIFEVKKGELFGEAEEWLARVCCFAFSISPQAFVKQQNRATAESAKDSADEEGLAPTMQWVKDVMDDIIERFYGDDIEFKWETDTQIDAKTQAEIDQIYINAGVYNAEYVADRNGIDAKYIPDPAVIAAEKQAKAQSMLPGSGNPNPKDKATAKPKPAAKPKQTTKQDKKQ